MSELLSQGEPKGIKQQLPGQYEQQREFRERIAERIKNIWSRRVEEDPKLTQEHLAQQLGLSKSAVSYILSGRSTLALYHLPKLASLLGVKPAELLEAAHLSSVEPEQRTKVAPDDIRRAFDSIARMYPSLEPDERLDLATEAVKRVKDYATVEEIEKAISTVVVESFKRRR
jgi:transcriptional regulator with XRE-family HTH domain